jgi:hypothetical protein
LHPRSELKEGESNVGVPSSLSLAESLRAMPSAQRAVTRLHVFMNGFTVRYGGRYSAAGTRAHRLAAGTAMFLMLL